MEIFQAGHFPPSFAWVAQLRGMRYGYLLGKADRPDTLADVPKRMSLLAELEIK